MKKVLLSVFVATVMALTSAGISFAAEDGPQGNPPQGGPQGGPGGGGQGGGRRGGFNREEMQNRMYEMLKTRLGASDEEWTVLKPRVEKVMTLSRSERMGGFNMFRLMMMFRDDNNQGGQGRGFGRRGRPEGMEESEVEKAVSALEEVVKNENATEAEAKAALTKVREEREAARKELAKAREELREVLTLKQEALLVAIGLLD